MNKEELHNFLTDFVTKLITFLAIIILACTLLTSIKAIRAINKINSIERNLNQMVLNYDKVVQENDLLWRYVENIDCRIDLNDAIEKRDELIDYLQFIDE